MADSSRLNDLRLTFLSTANTRSYLTGVCKPITIYERYVGANAIVYTLMPHLSALINSPRI